jgi:23S rRNA (cytosine1962-C5)-methyltransferase
MKNDDRVVTVQPRGAARLRAGHVWVYRTELKGAEKVPPASIVALRDERGRALGSGWYSSASQIAVRKISDEALDERGAMELLRQRIREALAYRQQVVQDADAYRLIFSEADGVPGVIADRYNDIVAVQVLTQAMDREDVRAAVVGELTAIEPSAIVERVEARIRELESLPSRASGLVVGEKTKTIFTLNGIRFHFDALAGQKTGAFLDQRQNYAATAKYAHGRALDAFCYQGGFALHLAKKCDAVTALDISRPALEAADENGKLNGVDVEWIEANAFDLLKDYSAAGQQYDTIVLDPPAFAKSKRVLDTALRGYKELNLRALKMLRPGGVLVTCSCSYHVSEAAFLEMLGAAAADAHRRLTLLDIRRQAQDHPILINVPESSYLKCVIAHVSS